ncbi:RlpA-like double-psi beta-barrel domain-containing protein [Roseomonas sp. E05]|uniref:septal ring lytic transglycosylase RlpA family protein n=1 Tax=Roseomonas sp. E05 TaxID=3046310 RepID=UPI0024B8B1D6|nr:SPOR domain-containing protein [Roseomonas sp. E05]MDJ0389834.1 RlpA-like double-psi beta-barrel domain-containing protein [Roseomonas sp. E05]
MSGALRLLPATALAVLLGVNGCAPQGARESAQEGRYMVGEPYRMGGVWSYPREDFALQETGLAAVTPDARAGRRTANGEAYDPALLTAAHRTLQLPAILRVTNLENGLELRVRVNDRGPASPGRQLELSRRAAELLRIPPAGGVPVAIAVDPEASRALAASLPQPEARPLAIATAPRAALESEALPPPPGARVAGQVRQGREAPVRAVGIPDAAASVPVRLPEQVMQGAPRMGRLLVEAGTFTNRAEAYRQAARIRGRVEMRGPPRRPEYRVRLGPFASVAQADAALENVLGAGVPEARILID